MITHQAADSVTKALYTWTAASYDNGAGYPGPNAATNVVVIGGMLGAGTPAPPAAAVFTLVQTDVSLTSAGNTLIDTRPASPSGAGRWKLVSVDLRIKTALTGSGVSAAVRVGTTSGATDIVLDQTVLTSTPTGTIVGGLQLASLGLGMGQTTGFEAMYSAGQAIYLGVAVSGGTPTAGTVTAYLTWQGLP